ncbi:DUF349 domain-containing protein [Cytophagaceae bacterium ABcell3]|nr:DUF349 domain-containing protein [Cytophagaceae bacterium ABcell3]
MSSDKEILEGKKNLQDINQPVKSGRHPEDNDYQDEGDNANEDYSDYSKADLLRVIETYRVDGNYVRAGSFLKEVKANFDNIIEAERAEAFENYLNEGGDETGFSYKLDDLSKKFYSLFDKLKEEVSNHFSKFEKEKEKNLAIKNELLEKLRNLISSEETNTSITSLKEIQEEWKAIGPVPGAYVQDLWASYNALVERFYNNRSIYFELKELDRKKNLEAKVELCEKAEKLLEETNVLEAIKELKNLHNDYKHIGPVPREEQENLWLRFKSASDKLYEKRNELFRNQKANLEENYKKKLAVIEKMLPYAEFSTERIDEWKEKTSEVLNLQVEWKQAGAVPQEKSKEASKRFWSACKAFFHNKEKFFKELESVKVENLKKKVELCEQAEALKDDGDFVNTARTLKDLQKQWEGIGPVPIKQKDAIFKRFKTACDHFFNRKREFLAEEEKAYHENLKKKQEICDKIEALAEEDDLDVEDFQNLQEAFANIGFVPKSEIKSIQARYKSAVDTLLANLDTEGDKEKEKVKLMLKVGALKNVPAGQNKLNRTESDINKKIGQLKGQIDLWTNNIEFFGNSKNADKLKADFENKIQQAHKELDELKEQKKIISEYKK